MKAVIMLYMVGYWHKKMYIMRKTNVSVTKWKKLVNYVSPKETENWTLYFHAKNTNSCEFKEQHIPPGKVETKWLPGEPLQNFWVTPLCKAQSILNSNATTCWLHVDPRMYIKINLIGKFSLYTVRMPYTNNSISLCNL